MNVTLSIVGGEAHEFEVDGEETYADLLEEVDVSPHEVAVLVDGTPVPEDQPVDAREIEVVRLVKGG